ncbi:MAG: gamma-glutamylcyclotransferase [Candidatus Aenigmarchaeota archaeon]|nr:gamma-glutamylcyclotransferase [Candidatus Aenigmarchaeota archaeon]
MVKYFGYGANKSPRMMKAIVGERPSGILAVLHDYELVVQEWGDIPPEVRKILAQTWDRDFRSYGIRPKKGSAVRGRLWNITREERYLVKAWEICPIWYEPVVVPVRTYDGRGAMAETEIINRPVGTVVKGNTDYVTFLNPPNRMFDAARLTREEYLQNRSL